MVDIKYFMLNSYHLKQYYKSLKVLTLLLFYYFIIKYIFNFHYAYYKTLKPY